MAKIVSYLFVAVVLGLGWAMRGHFGHEWGASWAGAMGVLAVLLVSGRKDWIRKAPSLAALGAIGWGAGGMMSYGIVIGYCRSISFENSLYGYAMLAVIGGLYGFIGGGLFGLGLESSEKNKPNWPNLIVQMFAGGFLIWGLLIYQMEWFMTPPRSELWAACFGAAIALAWFLNRNNFKKALRVALFSALGAGFGFAFGNFIQILGHTAEIQYNWWNVMEFTLGFFGGLGMIYAVLSNDWPESIKVSKTGNWIALIFVFLFIPLTNYFNGFTMNHFAELAGRLSIADVDSYANKQFIFGGIAVLVFSILAILAWRNWSANDENLHNFGILALLLIIAIQYNLFCYLKLGTFVSPFTFANSHSLYIFIIILILFTWYFNIRKQHEFPGRKTRNESGKTWAVIIISLVIIIILVAIISINIHDEIPGAHNRF
ncbi:MAG: hypothetical protein U9N86_17240 [Bacteroidota bacterium]|nr:hypothetical protein [Bacteroidota bacterium]